MRRLKEYSLLYGVNVSFLLLYQQNHLKVCDPDELYTSFENLRVVYTTEPKYFIIGRAGILTESN